MSGTVEQKLLTSAFNLLAGMITDAGMKITQHARDEGDDERHAMWDIQAANQHRTIIVQGFKHFIPRDVNRVLGGDHRLMRRVIREPIVVVAPWLSPRSRDVLREQGINYIDLTGNVLLRAARPAIYIQTDGAQQDPNPPTKPPVRLRGSGINALIRVLAEVEPPYRLIDLAAASGLSNAYVSRALDGLAGERLIERDPRSRVVTHVDWQGLLRTRAQNYSLLKSNRSQTFIARTGLAALLRKIGGNDDQAIITGSFAATRYVQITAPAQLTVYVPDLGSFAQRYGLIPAQQGANVILLTAADESQLARARTLDDGTRHVGISQLVLDCLAGNGRLPEEGDALIEWMAADPSIWRHHHLSELM